MSQLTVAQYAVDRLSKLGITDCFGVPGDYAFPINDAIASSKSIEWRGCSNELNASYAADGFPDRDKPAFANANIGRIANATGP